MTAELTDVDELVGRCRSDAAKEHIEEAVVSYKAGAFRAAIIMTWVAVVYDLVDKLRELALTGDANATAVVKRFEKLQAEGDVAGALKFENELLMAVEADFEFLSPLEREDLERLHTDRHKCGHPSMAREEEKYRPPAELAHLHLRNAVTYVLEPLPVQGKAALGRLCADVESEYFPENREQALQVLQNGPLSKPRDSLVRNFVVATLKTALNGELDSKRLGQRYAALGAAWTMHQQACAAAVKDVLPRLLRALPDPDLGYAVRLLAAVPELAADDLPDDILIKLDAYTAAMPQADISSVLVPALSTPFTASSADAKTGEMTLSQIRELVSTLQGGAVPTRICDRLLELYEQAGSFDEANSIGAVLISVSHALNADQARRLVGASTNSQVRDSWKFGDVLSAIRQVGILGEEDFDGLVRDNTLVTRFGHLMFVPPVTSTQSVAAIVIDDDSSF